LTNELLGHLRHEHFFKIADFSDVPISKFKLRKSLLLVTKSQFSTAQPQFMHFFYFGDAILKSWHARSGLGALLSSAHCNFLLSIVVKLGIVLQLNKKPS